MGRAALHVCLVCIMLVTTMFDVSLRADFADDEYIQELIHWTHPHTEVQTDFQYTEQENFTMLRLPRKECRLFSLRFHMTSHL